METKILLIQLTCFGFFIVFATQAIKEYSAYHTVTNAIFRQANHERQEVTNNDETFPEMEYQFCGDLPGSVNFSKIKINNQDAEITTEEYVLEYGNFNSTCVGVNTTMFDSVQNLWFTYGDRGGVLKYLKYRFKNDLFYVTKYLALIHGETLRECNSIHFVFLKLLPAPYSTDCVDYLNELITEGNATTPLGVYCDYVCTQLEDIVNDAQLDLCEKRCIKTQCKYVQKFKYYVENIYNYPSVLIENSFKISVISEPHLKRRDFILYILGLVGAFFDFAILPILSDARRKFRRLLRHRRRRRIIANPDFIPTIRKDYQRLFWRLLKYCTNAIVLTLAALHMRQSISAYLSYNHSTDMFISEPIQYPVPNISVCITMEDQRRFGKNISRFELERQYEKLIMNPDANFKISFHQMTLTEERFKFDGEKYHVTLRNLTKFIPSEIMTLYNIGDAERCIRFDNPERQKIFKGASSHRMIDLDIDPSLDMFGVYRVYLHFEDVPRASSGTHSLEAWFASKSVYDSLSMIERNILPAPYSTRCRDYPSIGFLSRAHCIDACVDLASQIEDANINVSDANAVVVSEKNCLASECLHDDCIQKSFHNHGLFRRFESARFVQMFGVLIYFPEISHRIVLSPAYLLPEFLAGLAAIISFWTGVCVLQNTTSILNYVMDMKENLSIIKPIVSYVLHTSLIIALIFQLASLSHNYHKYDTLTNIKIRYPDKISFPIFFLTHADGIDYYKLLNEPAQKILMAPPTNFNRLFTPTDQLFEYIEVFNPITNALEIFTHAQSSAWNMSNALSLSSLTRTRAFTEFIQQEQKVIKIDFNIFYNATLVNLRDARYKLQSENGGYLVRIKTRFKTKRRFALDIKDADYTIRGYHKDIGTDIFTRKLLPHPFWTKCRDAHETSIQTLEEDYGMKNISTYTYPVSILNSKKRQYFPKWYLDFQRSIFYEWREWTPNCESAFYVVRDFNSNSEWDFLIKIPKIEISVQYASKLTLIQSIVMALDSFDLWLGVNFSFILTKSLKFWDATWKLMERVRNQDTWI